MTQKPDAARPEPTMPRTDLTLDAAVEQMLLDAQLVAHAQAFDRKTMHAQTQLDELAIVVLEIADTLEDRGAATLRMLGLTLARTDEVRDGFQVRLGNEYITVAAHDDLRIWIGSRPVARSELHFTEQLYQSVSSCIFDWALARIGSDREIWGRTP